MEIAAQQDDWARRRARLGREALRRGLVDIAVARHETPFGRLLLCATSTGLTRVGLPSESEDAVLTNLAARVSPRILFAPQANLSSAGRALDLYFAGTSRAIELSYDRRLESPFQAEILNAARAIPFGTTVSYAELAAATCSPKAVRAVGTALATNPLPIVIPCHRVIRSDGELGGYRGGEQLKASLLEFERKALNAEPHDWG